MWIFQTMIISQSWQYKSYSSLLIRYFPIGNKVADWNICETAVLMQHSTNIFFGVSYRSSTTALYTLSPPRNCGVNDLQVWMKISWLFPVLLNFWLFQVGRPPWQLHLHSWEAPNHRKIGLLSSVEFACQLKTTV